MKAKLGCAIVALALVSASPLFAETAADFGGPNGGSIRVGSDLQTCSSAKDGALRFTSSTDLWEFCNGSAWTPFTKPLGYFVQTATKWNGNLGGISGANSKCLTELQTTYDWQGKSSAGALTSTRVKAFICDGTTCNNMKPNTVYFLAKANNTAAGGSAFKTNGSGQGPQTANFWDEDAMAGDFDTWTNRGTGTAELWGATPQGTNHCTNWTSSSSGVNGRQGNAGNDDATRWSSAASPCNELMYLYCFVDP